MEPIVIYCKSYQRDVLRVKRLAQSIQQFNVESIPFYLSVPDVALPLFQQHLVGLNVILIRDEDIIAANPKLNQAQIDAMPGGLSQQVVKSEFWRLDLCENYVCIDSDGEFVRDFRRADFLAPDGFPYSVISEDKEFLTFCERYHLPKVPVNFQREAAEAQQLFGREGKAYSFGIPPLVWSRQVWKSLEDNILIPKGWSFADLINQYPYELRLYGEVLMRYRPIPLWPCEPFFKYYLYNSQFFFDQKHKISKEIIAKNYLGIVWQSNWDGEHFGDDKKPFLSRLLRKLKYQLRKLSI